MFRLINLKHNYNFIGKRKPSIIISTFFMIISIISFTTQGLNWGIDFSSGYVVQLKFEKNIPFQKLEIQLKNMELMMQSYNHLAITMKY